MIKKGTELVPLEVRFWFRVDMSDQNGCWNWTGAHASTGHGIIRVKGKNVPAHRISWSMRHGEIPEGMEICHHCDNPRCVNPDHLFLGTHAENMRDMFDKGRAKYSHLRLIGEDDGASRLTEQQVCAIRNEYQSGGISQRQLAKKYKIAQSTVGLVVRHETWKHIY